MDERGTPVTSWMCSTRISCRRELTLFLTPDVEARGFDHVTRKDAVDCFREQRPHARFPSRGERDLFWDRLLPPAAVASPLGTGVPSQENAFPWDPTAGLSLWPQGGGCFQEAHHAVRAYTRPTPMSLRPTYEQCGTACSSNPSITMRTDIHRITCWTSCAGNPCTQNRDGLSVRCAGLPRS